MIRAAVLASMAAAASAMCAGDTPCSGHGACGVFDKCDCHRNWQGEDCSERTCPFETSFNSVAVSTGTTWAHQYTECSSKGTCDRSSGVCECFDGYDGAACRRMACDEGCNGHGTCESMSDISSTAYTGWDAHKIQKCVCDAGYEGDKCESRMCKKGDDPITQNVDESTATYQVPEEQTLTFVGGSEGAAGEFTLSYTDWRGRAWTTWGITAQTVTAGAIEEALEALPNSAIPGVTVTMTSATVYVITFDHAALKGPQAALVADYAGCNVNGCQPRFVAFAGSGTMTVGRSTPGTHEWAVCSNRGACDADTGLCACYNGFSGERCDIQTVIV